ncbi:MAG TPA: hypothetical protein VNR89_03935 [Roseomonas sp.]|nr:hypothetical protein [Roseomonas sp.]
MLGITIRHSASGIRLSGSAGDVDLTPLSKTQLSDAAHHIAQAAGIREANPQPRRRKSRRNAQKGSN